MTNLIQLNDYKYNKYRNKVKLRTLISKINKLFVFIQKIKDKTTIRESV